MELNLADLFEQVVDAVPHRLAVVADGRRLTYAELDRRANRLAHCLHASAVGPGDFVGLQLVNGTEYLEGMLACFKLRAVPVNVNYRYVDTELRHLYADAGLVGLVHHRQFAPMVGPALDAMAERRVVLEVGDRSGGTPSVWAGDYEVELAAQPDERPAIARSADDLYCVYTGGTTGFPKGVLWRQEDIFFAAMGGGDPLQLGDVIERPEQLAERLLDPGMVALPIPPFIHASAHWLAFSTFFGGGRLVLLPGGHFDPATVWRLVAEERVNVVVVVGDAMARPLLDLLERDPAAHDTTSLMAIGSGGAILSRSTKERMARLLPGVLVADAFGSSETGQLGGAPPADDPFGAPRLRVDDRTAVLDEGLQPVAPGSGVVGLLARGGRVPLGYRGDAAPSSATFVEVDGRRWALPGDLARVEADGTITVLGRSSECINSGGEKIYPEEVEAALKAHPDVVDAVVVGLPDERWGERVTAVVQARAGTDPSLDDLRGHARSMLAGYKLPKQLVVVEQVERLPSGKADYRWAKARAGATSTVGSSTKI
ncbi:MAG TPA: acyl-CoA synthetase [Acidimicrobiales bacterium]|nr:acyl-CoA synthetase [Acidimicrobiales bacterium]